MREHGAAGRELQRQAHDRRDAHRARTPTRRRDATRSRAASPCRSSSPASWRSATRQLIRSAIDLHQAGNNPQAGLSKRHRQRELMTLVRSLDSGNAWAVGRFDALASQGASARLASPASLPAITLVCCERPHQRRTAGDRSRRSARRRGRQQPARRRSRVHGAGEDAGRIQPERSTDDAVARTGRHRQDRRALVQRCRRKSSTSSAARSTTACRRRTT